MVDSDFYKDLLDNLYDGIYFVDRDRVITYWNKGAERITGYTASQAVGRACRDNMLNHVTANGVQLCLAQCPLAACMEDGNLREAEVFLHHADGHRVPIKVRASPIRNPQGEIVGAVEMFSYNTAVMEARRQLRRMRRNAMTDVLTNIANRRKMESHLRIVAAEYADQQNPVGLIFMDIDRFKSFNDTYGHNVGDDVLRMVANTLRLNLRATDMVGRWAGDEFLVIVNEIDSKPALKNLAQKLCALISVSHLDANDKILEVTVSVGVTLLRKNDTPESLVGRADQLMYESKQRGGNCVTIG